MKITYSITPSVIGHLLVGLKGDAVCAVRLHDSVAELMRILQDDFIYADLEHNIFKTAPVVSALQDYLSGRRTSFDEFKLDIEGTDFQKKVWQQLREIPYGSTMSYAEVAEEIGAPSAVRAVGTACGANPALLMVPCHRIIGKDGGLGGFSGGLNRKRFLLMVEEENRPMRSQVAQPSEQEMVLA